VQHGVLQGGAAQCSTVLSAQHTVSTACKPTSTPNPDPPVCAAHSFLFCSNGVQLSQAGLEFNYAKLFGESQGTQFRASGLVAL